MVRSDVGNSFTESPVLPGGTVGIIGGGQLARMMALAARRMGYRIAVLDPSADASGSELAHEWVQGGLDDVAAAKKLAALSDVVTVDTEHVPASLLAALMDITCVRPAPRVLEVVQDRWAQRTFLSEHEFPQPRVLRVDTAADGRAVAEAIGVPCIVKTRRSGYDGKGQVRVERAEDFAQGIAPLAGAPAVAEEFVPFDREISVVLARAVDGEIRTYPIAHNEHRRHVLHTTVVPATLPDAVADEAIRIASGIAHALDHVGVMAVEMFVVNGEKLLVNEIAPRTHNSGHYTFGACATSQFEQHVRAICGLTLGDTTLHSPVAMINLLGDLWNDGPPDWRPILAHPAARLHLYEKKKAYPGRKMGHILVQHQDPEQARQEAESLLEQLK